MAGGCAWQGGMCGRGCAWQGDVHGRDVHGRGVCGRGHAWQGACVVRGGGACVAGKMAIAAGSTHPTGIHSCL